MADSLIDWEGTVVPSFLSQGGEGASGFFSGFQQPQMLPGRVKTVYYPDHVNNRSKVYTEYDVEVEQMAGNGIVTRKIIPRCRVMNLFGGVSDFETWTPRPIEGDSSSEGDVGQDSQVLVLCVNGTSQEGVIIGGIPHTKNEVKNAKDDGHYWKRKFNGCEMLINNDGEFHLTFNGATDAKDALKGTASPENSGSKLILSKDGSLKMLTRDEQQFLHLDHTGKKIDIKADTSWTVNVAGTWQVKTTGATTHEALAAGTGYTVNAPAGLIHLNSNIGTKLGAGTNLMLLGTTYRTAEITKNSARISGFTALGVQLGAAGGSLTAAGGILQAVSVLHKIPVAGAVLGSVPLQAAAAAVMAAGGVLTALAATLAATLVTPLVAFEAGAPTYLSVKNSLD